MKNRHLRIICVSLLCVISVSYIITLTSLNIKHFEETIDHQVQKYLLTVARSQMGYFEDVFNDILMGLEKAGYVILKKFSYDSGSLDSYFDHNIQRIHENIQAHAQNRISQLCWIDSKGTVLSVSTESDLFEKGMDLSMHDGVMKAIKHSVPSAETTSIVNSARVISFNVPVVRNNRTEGIIKAVITLEDLKEIINKDSMHFSGYTWLTDARGTILMHPDKTLQGKSVFSMRLRQFGDEQQEDRIVRQMLNGVEGACSYISELKSKSKSTMAWVPVEVIDQQWPLAVYMDYDKEISIPMKRHSQNTFIMLFCFILSFGAAGVFYFIVEKRKTQQKAHRAINRINDQLNQISEERHQTETGYRNRIYELENIIASIPYGIFWKNRNSVYLGCNQSFARMAGLQSPIEICGKVDKDIGWLRDHGDYFKKCDRDVVKTGIPLLNIELHDEKGKFTLLLSQIPLRNSKDKITGVLGVLTDITNLKKDQEVKLKYFSRQLEKINQQPDPILITGSNDTVVYVNNSYCSIFDRPVEDIIQRRVYDVVESPVAEQIRLNSGKDSNSSEETACSEIISVSNKEYLIRMKKIFSRNRYEGMIVCLTELSEMKDQIRAGGSDEITHQYVMSLCQQVRNTLSDIQGYSGKLMQQETAPEKLNFASMINESTVGLLQIINEMSECEGQETYHDIQPVKPRKPDEEDVPESEVEDRRHALPESEIEVVTGRVLVADDVNENRMLIEAFLRKEGYIITHCRNGQEAVEAAGNDDFDVILMDIQMPVMDGKQATKKIRSGSRNKHTPILALTASINQTDELSCLEAGCDDVIRKPLKKNHLVRKVWRCVQQSRQIRIAESGGDIVSFLIDDPDYTKTIETFIDNLSGRITEIQELFDKGDMQQLSKKAHAMKGLGGFAGFPIYTEKAKQLELLIMADDIDKIRTKIDEIVDLAGRTKRTRA